MDAQKMERARMGRWTWMAMAAVALAAVGAGACGGAPVEAPAPVAVAAVEVVEEAPDTRIFYVFVDEIQALNVYPEPGPVRNESRMNERAPWGTTSAHFSIFSVYEEGEERLTPAIAAATSLDDLLVRLAAVPGVRVEEGVNPAYESVDGYYY
jgi:hypothetical protein